MRKLKMDEQIFTEKKVNTNLKKLNKYDKVEINEGRKNKVEYPLKYFRCLVLFFKKVT